jgi:uncharacterized protein YbcC (UPF0753/DUF2309 family)
MKMEIDRLLQKQQLNVQKSALVCPAKSTRPRLKSLLLAEVSGPDFTWQCAKKAFSPVNDQAAWANRLFQQNRPKAVLQITVTAEKERLCSNERPGNSPPLAPTQQYRHTASPSQTRAPKLRWRHRPKS